MLKLHHESSRDYLREHLPEIKTGVTHLKQVLALEVADDVADCIPTAIFDNYARTRVYQPFNQRLDDFLAYLEGQAK